MANLDKLAKISFFVFFLSSIEWTMRKLISQLWPGECNCGKADFKPSYDFLLKKVGLMKYRPLYDLCRLVRNTIHSGGIYLARSGNDQRVSWKGNTFSFVYAKPVDFMTHGRILELDDDLIESLQELLGTQEVKNAVFISDKMK